MINKKRFFRFLVLFFILVIYIFTPSITLASENYSKEIAESNPFNEFFDHDADGLFNGVWHIARSSHSGSMNGSIYFGRSDEIGKIKGKILDNDSFTSYSITAIIGNRIIFGIITSEIKSHVFVGKIDLQMPHYSFSIYSPMLGKITGNGSFDGSFLPKPSGRYEVGVSSYHLVDTSRDEWFTEDDDSDKREFMIKIWYPSQNNSFSNRMDYMDPITFLWLRNQGPVPLISIPKDAYSFVHPYIYQDTSPVSSQVFPVLLFSPGYDGVDSIYTSFIDDLVSNGYIVVSMNHPYISGVTVFPDGRTIYIAERPGNYSESSDFLKQSQQTVVDDALFTLDFIENLNKTDGLFSGMFDCSKIGMFGHSFGGAATINCCFLDDRISAGLTLDGLVYDEFITDTIDTPILLMCAEQRFNHSSYDYVWNQISSDAYQVGVVGSTHYGYSDVGILISHLLPLIPSTILGFGTIDAKYLIEVTRQFENAFFDVYLKGAEKDVLTTLFDNFNDVRVRIK